MIWTLLCCTSSKTIVISSSDEIEVEDTEVTTTEFPEFDEEFCAEAPNITWENWAQTLFITHCQGCHAQSSPNTYGAPAEIHFDHEAATIELADRIWIRVLEEETMPPAGGILEEDLYLLDVWLRCTVGL